MRNVFITVLLASLSVTHASPVFSSPTRLPGIVPVRAAAEHPLITPSPSLNDPTRTVKLRRGIISDIKSGFHVAESKVEGVIGSELSGLPTYVASGVANFFQDFPTGDKVQSSLGLDDDQVAALPTQVLNVP